MVAKLKVFCGIMRKYMNHGACGGCQTFSPYSEEWHKVRDSCPEYQRWLAAGEARKRDAMKPKVKPDRPVFRLKRAVDDVQY